ncbi:glutamate-rich protein 1 isoform X2 [Hemicordylus capensis]|uniref:glutamate-rich protein 1 isoform X2 n=1 Tax=Hemicordylus capensis TaxID=884348 RepID=UPI0023029DEE|nr:glutamate-rich protein 1 isoform X2 [Hemicordylus capensis]
MALSKRTEVFKKKVLEKLFSASPPGIPDSDSESGIVPETVSEPKAPKSIETSEGYSSLPEEEYQGQPKRKRIRKKKHKNVLQNHDNLHGDQAECGRHERLIEDNFQLQCTDGPSLSRNKKRKMKKKRQKEKMRAAGLLTKPTGIDFIYQPEREEKANFEDADKKADDILDFLQATQEIYFSEKRSKCEDSAVSSESVHEIVQCLESRSISSSDISLLHQMKSFVLLQDVERLKGSMEEFQIHSDMPSGKAKLYNSSIDEAVLVEDSALQCCTASCQAEKYKRGDNFCCSLLPPEEPSGFRKVSLMVVQLSRTYSREVLVRWERGPSYCSDHVNAMHARAHMHTQSLGRSDI